MAASRELTFGFLAPIRRKPAEGIDTGVAIANLEDQEIRLSLFLKNREGVAVAESEVTLAPRAQISRFVGEFQWNHALPEDVEGTLQVITTNRIGATAVQMRPGQFSTMPVSPLLPVDPVPSTALKGMVIRSSLWRREDCELASSESPIATAHEHPGIFERFLD